MTSEVMSEPSQWHCPQIPFCCLFFANRFQHPSCSHFESISILIAEQTNKRTNIYPPNWSKLHIHHKEMPTVPIFCDSVFSFHDCTPSCRRYIFYVVLCFFFQFFDLHHGASGHEDGGLLVGWQGVGSQIHGTGALGIITQRGAFASCGGNWSGRRLLRDLWVRAGWGTFPYLALGMGRAMGIHSRGFGHQERHPGLGIWGQQEDAHTRSTLGAGSPWGSGVSKCAIFFSRRPWQATGGWCKKDDKRCSSGSFSRARQAREWTISRAETHYWGWSRWILSESSTTWRS